MAIAFGMLVVVPAVLIGLAPIVATIWARKLSTTPGASGAGALLFIAGLLALAWYGGRPLFRVVEGSFWSLNAMAIQPGYVTCREVLLHLSGRLSRGAASETTRARGRAMASAISGVVISALALVVLRLVWPATHWVGTLSDFRTPHWLLLTALANATAVGAAYLAIAGLVWGILDATMPQPRELDTFRSARDFVRAWRVAHLSDIHVVGERYGFRLGSGRAGPRGNDGLVAALERLDELHRRQPLDAILITGDLTDAGTSAEWSELLDILGAFPRLEPLIVALPGNHDLNIVDRANPARLDLPTSPKKRLREVRTLSALAAMQGTRVHVVDDKSQRVGPSIDRAFASKANDIAEFASRGSRRLGKVSGEAWSAAFPMIRPPDRDDGLGIIVLNSNAETHFSFTNALGLMPTEEARALDVAMRAYPHACWIVGLHHHIVEHPKLGHALAERIGTTLINGNWFTRRLQDVGRRIVVMHGHRHIDWMGQCGDVLILSAPSAVMPASKGGAVYFYVHTVGVDSSGGVGLGVPERVEVRAPLEFGATRG
jgi:predicted MPP superfamily phosphohydrolase